MGLKAANFSEPSANQTSYRPSFLGDESLKISDFHFINIYKTIFYEPYINPDVK
jgi:hypothetical protein